MLLLFLLACAGPKGIDSASPATDSATAPTSTGAGSVPTTASEPAAAVSVHTGPLASCALTDAGAVLCWGEAPVADAVPEGRFVDLAVGTIACAVHETGALACWGDDTFDGGMLAAVPAGDFVAVDVAELFACALDGTGAVTCWGALDWVDGDLSTVPPPTEPLATVRAGSYIACGLTQTGTVACWGADEEFPPNQPDLDLLDDAPQGQPATDVDAFRYAGCMLDLDGALACWGAELGSESDTGIAGRPPAGRFVDLSLGHRQACAVDDGGRLHCWGVGATTPPAGDHVQVSAGYDHGCAVKTDGSVVCWGEDDAGETWVPPALSPG
ncbi:MAG: hypothetical protein ACI8PZ_005541 [Myxococcota bacterium]|jgi:hypothetical protein